MRLTGTGTGRSEKSPYNSQYSRNVARGLINNNITVRRSISPEGVGNPSGVSKAYIFKHTQRLGKKRTWQVVETTKIANLLKVNSTKSF